MTETRRLGRHHPARLAQRRVRAAALVVVVMASRRPAVRRFVCAVVVPVVLVVCADRLMLGRYYVTDLVGGGALLATGLVLVGMALLNVQLGAHVSVQPGMQKGRHLADDAPSGVARPDERELVLSRSA